MPQATSRRIVITAYDGVSLLDLAGPLEAFRVASTFGGPRGHRGRYECSVVSVRGSPVRTADGVELVTDVELVNSFPASKAAHVQTPEGITFAWELLPPVTMPLLRQFSHELLPAIYSQTDVRDVIYLPSLVCTFEGTNLKGACVPEGYSRIEPVHGKDPAVIQRKSGQS